MSICVDILYLPLLFFHVTETKYKKVIRLVWRNYPTTWSGQALRKLIPSLTFLVAGGVVFIHPSGFLEISPKRPELRCWNFLNFPKTKLGTFSENFKSIPLPGAALQGIGNWKVLFVKRCIWTRCWCIITVYISFANSDWHVSCDNICTVIVHLLVTRFATIGGSRRQKGGYMLKCLYRTIWWAVW